MLDIQLCRNDLLSVIATRSVKSVETDTIGRTNTSTVL